MLKTGYSRPATAHDIVGKLCNNLNTELNVLAFILFINFDRRARLVVQ